jgi:hypothetical protein
VVVGAAVMTVSPTVLAGSAAPHAVMPKASRALVSKSAGCDMDWSRCLGMAYPYEVLAILEKFSEIITH